MSINDLSPGIKLSLKGKLFELQKKLTLLDLEKKLSDDVCPFQPHFYSSDKHHRDKPEEDSNKRNKNVDPDYPIEDPDECEFTYRPRVNNRKVKSAEEEKYISQPVHIRLYEKAKLYQEKKTKLAEEITTRDETGRLLFQPKINRLNGDEDEANNSNIKVQEYLYRDALVYSYNYISCEILLFSLYVFLL